MLIGIGSTDASLVNIVVLETIAGAIRMHGDR